jgi:ubiquinone/menaquinone biosynthesis C-methylase UbiE
VTASDTRSAAGLAERELASFYDDRYAGDYMAEQPALEVRRVEQLLGEVRGPVASVLDFGCGRGGWIPVVERCFPGAALTGIDISDAAVEQARASFPSHRFLSFDGKRAPLADASAELVFCYHVLEHVLDLDAAVAEIARVLAPLGQACVILPCGNRGSLEERVARMGRDGIDPETGRFFYEDPGHLRRLTSDALIALFAREGLTVVRSWYANQLWGAVDYLTRVGHGVPAEVFDPSRAVTRAGRAKLTALRLGGAALTPFMLAHSLSRPGARIREARGARERVRWGAALAAKAAAYPVGRAVEGMARREWERDRERPNGALQFLLLEKQ